MKQQIASTIAQLCTLGLLFAGLYLGITGALNLALFIIVGTAVAGLAICFIDEGRKVMRQSGPVSTKGLIFAGIIIGTLIWYGYFAAAITVLIYHAARWVVTADPEATGKAQSKTDTA